MRQFITLHALGRVDQIPYEVIRETMPHTKLEINENRQLNYITDWIWGNGYRDALGASFNVLTWATDLITGGSDELKAVAESVGEENMEEFDTGSKTFPEYVQPSIDQNLREYIGNYYGSLWNADKIERDEDLADDKLLFHWKCTSTFDGCDGVFTKHRKHEVSVQLMVIIKAIMNSLQEEPTIDIFEEYLAGRHEQLEISKQVKLEYFLGNLYGPENLEVMWKVVEEGYEISTDDFEPIQQNMEQFIEEYYSK